jgi:hypothetical protein
VGWEGGIKKVGVGWGPHAVHMQTRNKTADFL